MNTGSRQNCINFCFSDKPCYVCLISRQVLYQFRLTYIRYFIHNYDHMSFQLRLKFDYWNEKYTPSDVNCGLRAPFFRDTVSGGTWSKK